MFIAYLKVRLRKEEKIEGNMDQLSPSYHPSLKKMDRGQFSLWLEKAGRDRIRKFYQQLKDKENDLLLLLKVMEVSLIILDIFT